MAKNSKFKPKNQKFNKSRPKSKGKSNTKGRRDAKSYDPDKDNHPLETNPPEIGGNDASLWMGDGVYSKEVCRISTFVPAGAKQTSPEIQENYWTPAGIMRLDYVPCFGEVHNPTDAINVAAKRLYDYINSKNSRNPNYDPSDLMIYNIAVASAWSVHSVIRRLIGMYNTFNPLNRYWWNSVVESMGFAPISVDNDIVAWRHLANRMAIKLNSLSVPNDIKYYQRSVQMCENVYKDSNVTKASLFYFSPASVMKYDYDNEGISRLTNVNTPWTLATYGYGQPATPVSVENWFNNLIYNLFNDSDINTIAADIIKAYGMENCFRLPLIDEGYQILPVFVPEINMQLNNARISLQWFNKEITGTDHYRLSQNMNRNCLVSEYDDTIDKSIRDAWMCFVDYHKATVPLNFHFDDPSEEEVMVSTRLCNFYTNVEEGLETTTADFNACTEVLVNAVIYTYHYSNSAWSLTNVDNVYCPYNTVLDTAGKKLQAWSKFHDAPINYFIVKSGSGSTVDYYSGVNTYFISDVDNYTTISVETLRRINEAATMSVFLPHDIYKS